ncbi:N-acetylgalactosamine-6-O-sulfatase [subsurface metagenome]
MNLLNSATLGLGIIYLVGAGSCSSGTHQKTDERPNIVYILADDLGYGDFSCMNEKSAWQTPHTDQLAKDGMIFTDAHSGSAVCTPTRYGILTGRYSWRSNLKSGVLWSWSPPLIEENRLTVGNLLQQHGYATACIGKWHLGLGWQRAVEDPDSADFSKPISGGPVELGFDYFYGITASLDIPPYVYIENNLSTTMPMKFTESKDKYGWWRKGHTGDDFVHEQVLPHLTAKAVEFIDKHVTEGKNQPFFLYFALPAPHTPILPTEEFRGKSGTNPYGDFVLQVDWTVGQIMQVLEKHELVKNTLFILTSDNGCSPQAQYEELAEFGHNPSYHFRGHKADIYEGGHHIPFIIRWPGKIKPGTRSDEVICLTDLLATCADIVGDTLPDNVGEDSYSILPAMSGQTRDNTIREATVHHSINGSFAIRKGKWKLCMCPGSGGWSSPTPQEAQELDLPPVQLYNLETDIGEQDNVVDQYPGIVEELTKLLRDYIKNGRSTPGESQEYVVTEKWPGLDWMRSRSDF